MAFTCARTAAVTAPRKTILAYTLSAILMSPLALAQETETSNPTSLEVVTVIGEKIERSLYDTASSVQVYDQEKIDSTPGATEISDLLKLTPNIVDAGLGNSLPSVRGIDGSGPSIGGLASFAGTSTRLNLSIDGRSLTYSEMAFGPRSLWDVQQAEVHLGPQSYIQGRNASAGAIVIKSIDPSHEFETRVKGGVGEQNYSQTAAMINVPIIQDQLAFRLSVDQQKRKSHLDLESFSPAGDSRKIETTNARAKVLFEPAAIEGFKTVLSFDYMDTRAPQMENVIGWAYEAKRPVYETGSTNGIWDVDWQLSEQWTFQNKLIISNFEYERITDPTGYQADFVSDGDELHIEPLMRYHSADDRLTALFGARYFKLSQDDTFTSVQGTSPMNGETETHSAFAEATYSVTPQVAITLAARFEKEQKKRKVAIHNVDYDQTISVFLPKFDVAYTPASNQTIGFNVAKGYNNGGAGLSFNSFDRFAPYLSYGYNEEFVWNYELYTRHGILDNTVELTSNIFFNQYDDMQVTQTRSDGYVVVQNLDSAYTYGAELGARWLPNYYLELFTNIGLLKTQYTQSAYEGGQDKELPRAPALSANFGALYNVTEDFEVSANAIYTGKYFSDLANSPEQKIDPYWTANAQVSYLFEHGRANLFATNLFDSNEATMVTFARAPDQPLTQAPRMIGASLELYF
ncbi:ligand-gated channel protein [Vibrio tubiashii]|nr:ligand-gated channel protein [Vibrio tubiashii]